MKAKEISLEIVEQARHSLEDSEERALMTLAYDMALPTRAIRRLRAGDVVATGAGPSLRVGTKMIPLSSESAEVLRAHIADARLAQSAPLLPPQPSEIAFERRLQRICKRIGHRIKNPTLSLQMMRRERLQALAKVMRFEDFVYFSDLSHGAASKWYFDVLKPDEKRIRRLLKAERLHPKA